MSTEGASKGVKRVVRALMGDDRSDEEIEREQRIIAALDRMTDGAVSRRRDGPFGLRPLGGIGIGLAVPTFESPVKHNSFSEWEQDYKRAKKAHDNVVVALEQLRAASEPQCEELCRVAGFAAGREGPGLSIIKCIAADNTHSAVISVLEVVRFWAYFEMTALESQRETYWSGTRGRKRHAKKYWVASELARVYVTVLNERPTFAMTDYGEPSGRFTTALREIFEICGLGGGDLRGPAEQAIANAPAVMQSGPGVDALGALMTHQSG